MIVKVLITCCALAAPLAAAAAEPAQEGMTVVRDPLTGRLRAPTAAELRALHGDDVKQPQMVAPQSTRRPDGTRVINLGERAMVYAVMTRNADGSLAAQCVKGDQDAAKAIEKKAEVEHDHQ